METKRILVIEDNQKHRADAKAFFADKPEYKVDYAGSGIGGIHTLVGGSQINAPLEWLKNNGYIKTRHVGVITDVFMPWDSSHFTQEAPIGFTIAKLCLDMSIPVVMNTTANHHGKNFQWMNELLPILGFDRKQLIDGNDVLDLVDREEWSKAFDTERENGALIELSVKNWARALEMLERQMNKTKS